MSKVLILCFVALTSGVIGDEHWKSIPEIPTNRRTQFYVLHDDGSYKYGYDTGKDGSYAKQKSSAANQVEGYYGYPNVDGNIVNIKYTAGVQGFVPENTQSASGHAKVWSASSQSQYQAPAVIKQSTYQDSNDNSDASYSLSYNAGDHSRTENSDASGNVKGSYSYTNEAGNHDLTYVAGPETGFVVTGGSLSAPIGGSTKSYGSSSSHASGSSWQQKQGGNSQSSSWDSSSNGPATDGSYSFSYNAGDSSRKESGDAAGNVQGQYAYTNEAGNHDLTYVAGADTGFLVTGGSLAEPNGFPIGGSTKSSGSSSSHASGSSWQQKQGGNSQSSSWDSSSNGPATDGSYSFSYNAGDSSRKESGDAAGNVQGQYAYTNEAGNHDLTYVAGAATGFLVTGGSLAEPNGLPIGGSTKSSGSSSSHASGSSWQQKQGGNSQSSSWDSSSNGPATDGSYSFSYNAGDSSRKESGDAAGNVQGQYAYTNEAGNHDLTYVAGADTGFLVTGGSLAEPNGLPIGGSTKSSGSSSSHASGSSWQQKQGGNSQSSSWDSNSNGPATDGSYSFSYNAGDSSRKESGNAAGNVQGQYAYTNEAGNHDLTYVAGPETGFVVTGGSLSAPNGLPIGGSTKSSGSSSSHASGSSWQQKQGGNSQSSSWDSSSNGPATDGSYSFSYNAGDSSRKESGDAAGNVQGQYAYTNEAGNHDLTYVAGADTGFLVTGGSLAEPNGLPIGGSTKSSGSSSSHASGSSWQQKQGGNSQSSSWDSSSNGPATDGSYSFSYNAGDSSRKESGDAAGNVQGQYAYTNEAGNHDLTYVAGAATGFLVTGGSLAEPNGLTGKSVNVISSSSGSSQSWNPSSVKTVSIQQTNNQDSWNNQLDTGAANEDGSYSFSYNTGDHSRSESADAAGNVKGQYAYTDDAGNHDLSYIAGDQTGFQVTGGSLSVPNGLVGKNINVKNSYGNTQSSYGGSSNSQSGYASQADDGSYKFSYNTGEHSRNEVGDASGNVQGSYSYQSESGNKDLHYKAGQEGFFVTGGNLAPKTDLNTIVPSGNSDDGSYKVADHGDHVKPPTQYLPPSHALPAPISTYKHKKLTNNDALVQIYLPPAHSHKYGYIYDTKH